MLIAKIKKTILKLNNIFINTTGSSQLKLDAFIFSKQNLQIRALVSGTGLYITIPLDRIFLEKDLLFRFSAKDIEIINTILNDTTHLYSQLIDGCKIEIIAKTINRKTKINLLKVAVTDNNDKNLELDLDPRDISRNKFLLQLFNKFDTYNIGYSAAENRIRTEQTEISECRISN